MQKNPFVILGVDEKTVTQNELFEVYKELRDKYSKLRFAQGEEGADACRKLDEIEAAYAEATEILRSRYDISTYGDSLKNVEDAIKENNLEKAQDLLDAKQTRSARWHYLQSVIFYRKKWYGDALKQLDFACQMEPDNTKYTDARTALINQIQSDTSKRSFYSQTDNGEDRSYRNMPPQGEVRGCTPCNCCSSLICADCCCECMGGDLITCC